MGEKITFRRGRNTTVTVDGAVSIVEPRVKFVRGWIDDGGSQPAGTVRCGDGELFCIEATVDQMCEIFYRVRDAR